MDKLVRNIIIGVVVVFLLVAAYIAIAVIPGQIEDKNNEEIKAEKGDFLIMSTSLDYVESVVVEGEKESYTFIKADNSWGIKEYPDMSFENAAIESAVYGYSNLYALEEVDMPSELSEYGLDKPQIKFTVNLTNGEQRKFSLGSKVTGGNGVFFADTTNSKAYVISEYTAESMIKEVNSFRKTKLASITANEVTRFAFKNKLGEVVLELQESDYTSDMVMRMTYPKHMDVDENVFNSIFENIKDITVVEFVEDNPKNLTKYGIGSSSVSVDIKTANSEYSIKFGNKTEGGIYTLVNGFDFVFVGGADLYDACENVSPYNIMNKFVNLANINDVKSITVEGKGKRHTLEIEGGDDFYVDGKPALTESFRKTYQSVIGIKGSGLAEKNISSPVEYTVEFVYKTGEKTNIVYASYDDINYYVEVNGERGFITLKKSVDDMMKTVETLAKKPMEKMN